MTYYLAVDIGASSGRHILGWLQNGKLKLEEVYRFSNEMEWRNGSLCWDYGRLYKEILNGLKKCKEIGKIPAYMGIDTWAVDFVLLDEADNLIGDTVAYRDARTQGMAEKVKDILSDEELYSRTGIQKLEFNTIYQLMSIKEDLNKAKTFLMVPEYFNFLLTGKKMAEYTNGTSTQLVSAQSGEWDVELLQKLGYPVDMFLPLQPPGTVVGDFSEAVAEEVGFSCQVMLPATHDTASAVMAIPTTDEVIYLSSGTWSLMGMERLQADCTKSAQTWNFTNEGGFEGRYRFLKNIMGLWLIQSLKKELLNKYSFAELCLLASQSKIASIIDCQDTRFLAPKSMISAVQDYCREHGLEVPETVSEIAAVIYNSLAACYEKTVKELEAVTGKTYDAIHIIGGGAQADYLNELTAKRTHKDVFAGPIEATAIGNIGAQMIGAGALQDLNQLRSVIAHSFEITTFRGGFAHVKTAV